MIFFSNLIKKRGVIMCEIDDIKARQLLASRANRTVEVDVKLIDGS